MKKALVRGVGICKVYREGRGEMCALHDIDIAIREGETFGLIGESGCGKSTLGQILVRLQEPSAGTVAFDGADISKLSASGLRAMCRRMQVVFQDPYASLNPRMSIYDALAEPLRIHRLVTNHAEEERRIAMLLDQVGLEVSTIRRYPHEFSGGQRQRIAIARALAVEPRFLVCDEVTASLDMSVRRQIVILLQELQRSLGLTYLFISHDLPLVERIADRIAVMHKGCIVEEGNAVACLQSPQHPYTKELVASSQAFDIRQHF